MTTQLEKPSVTVLVSPELVTKLNEWSVPVQVKIIETPGVGTGYEMIAMPIDLSGVASEQAPS